MQQMENMPSSPNLPLSATEKEGRTSEPGGERLHVAWAYYCMHGGTMANASTFMGEVFSGEDASLSGQVDKGWGMALDL